MKWRVLAGLAVLFLIVVIILLLDWARPAPANNLSSGSMHSVDSSKPVVSGVVTNDRSTEAAQQPD